MKQVYYTLFICYISGELTLRMVMAHREMTFLLNNIHSRIKRDILNFFHTHKKKLQVVIPNNLDLILLGTPAQFSAQCVKVGTFSRASTQH